MSQTGSNYPVTNPDKHSVMRPVLCPDTRPPMCLNAGPVTCPESRRVTQTLSQSRTVLRNRLLTVILVIAFNIVTLQIQAVLNATAAQPAGLTGEDAGHPGEDAVQPGGGAGHPGEDAVQPGGGAVHPGEGAGHAGEGYVAQMGAEQQSHPTEELRGVKITNVDSDVLYSDEAIAEAMDYLASIGINAVLPVVQNAGYTQYPSEVMNRYFDVLIDPRMAGRDPLDVLIREARRVGIEVYPWFEYGFAVHFSGGNPATGGFIGQRYPDWLARHANGDICKKNGFEWMSGINPDVQEFMLELVMEVVRNYDIDGIEFSDRMPALPRECGYDEATVALYRSEHGGADPPPFDRNASWMRWRADKLNAFYAAVRDSVLAFDPELLVASSPSIYPWAYVEYLQDPVSWTTEGIIDHLIPQLYRRNINDYVFELEKTLADLPAARRDIYFAGILMNVGNYLISEEFLGASLQANRDAGVAGEAYFFYEGLRKNDNALGDYLSENWYSEPAVVPRPARLTSSREDADRLTDDIPATRPGDPVLAWNYPNPFNSATMISVELPEGAETRITVHDITGRRVTLLHSGHLASGRHTYRWDASAYAGGIYIVQVRTDRQSRSFRMTLVK